MLECIAASPTTYTTHPASSDSPRISSAVIIQGQKMGALAFLTVLILWLLGKRPFISYLLFLFYSVAFICCCFFISFLIILLLFLLLLLLLDLLFSIFTPTVIYDDQYV